MGTISHVRLFVNVSFVGVETPTYSKVYLLGKHAKPKFSCDSLLIWGEGSPLVAKKTRGITSSRFNNILFYQTNYLPYNTALAADDAGTIV